MPGLTPVEAEVMRQWDANCPKAKIARSLGKTLDQVGRIVTQYHDAGEHRDSCAAIAKASQRLAAAISQARKAA